MRSAATRRSHEICSCCPPADGEADLSRGQIADLAARLSPLSLTKRGPRRLTGASNFWVDVADPAGAGLAPAARIWFLDSMDRGCGEEVEGYGCVGADTIAWFVQAAKALPPVETQILFVHIPLPEVRQAGAAPCCCCCLPQERGGSPLGCGGWVESLGQAQERAPRPPAACSS